MKDKTALLCVNTCTNKIFKNFKGRISLYWFIIKDFTLAKVNVKLKVSVKVNESK